MTTTRKPATPLPWLVYNRAEILGSSVASNRVSKCASGDAFRNESNAAFIVHACNAYPRLIAEVKWLKTEIETLANQGRASHGTVKRTNALLTELEAE